MKIYDLKQMAKTTRDKMEITDTEVSGFKMAILGMRNPMNSWEFSDSRIEDGTFVFGENDLKLAQSLIIAGSEHSKFMRMIHVQANVNMPRYFWSEADTYHFNTKNSCSTMHKLLNNKNKIKKDLFVYCEEDKDIVDIIVERLEYLRQMYLEARNNEQKDRLLLRAKRILLEGFLQMRTFDTNYAEIRNMYFQRRNHRLKEEWQQVFCKWVESLPYAKELILFEKPKEGTNGNIKER